VHGNLTEIGVSGQSCTLTSLNKNVNADNCNKYNLGRRNFCVF